MVIIDYKKGNVVALVGGAGKKTTLRGLNRATMMTRSPGSNMKPIGVYGPGLEKGVLTAATTFDDVPTTYKIGTSVWPIKNYDNKYALKNYNLNELTNDLKNNDLKNNEELYIKQILHNADLITIAIGEEELVKLSITKDLDMDYIKDFIILCFL